MKCRRRLARRLDGRLGLTAAAACLALTAACADEPAQPPARDTSGPTEVTATTGDDGVQQVTIDASDDYRFVPSKVHVMVGDIKITLVNEAKQSTHSLAFTNGPSEEIPYLGPGETKDIQFAIGTPGEYQFICTFHEALGQRGTMVVSQ